jgi:hypothetical protein
MKDVKATALCIPIPVDHVPMLWDKVAAMLEPAVSTARGKCTIEDLYVSILDGTYLLWAVLVEEEIVAAITTRIIDYPQCRGMAMDWIGGRKMREWLPVAMAAMVAHSKHNGCTHMEGYGRGAWARWIEKYGWKQDYIAFRMEV